MHSISVQLISYSVFSNANAELNYFLSLSFMTGKILDTSVFYKLGARLCTNPLEVDFITSMMEEIPGEKKMFPLEVNNYLKGRTYKEVYYEFLTDPTIAIMLFGVFSVQMGSEVNK